MTNQVDPMRKEAIKAKQRARVFIVQALYQWLMGEQPLSEIEAQFFVHADVSKVNWVYFQKVFYGVFEHLQDIEKAFSPFLDRAVDALNPVERSILRLGAFELIFCLDIPYRIVLDESISLAKRFGAQDGHRYINGVLHQLAKEVRAVEM